MTDADQNRTDRVRKRGEPCEKPSLYDLFLEREYRYADFLRAALSVSAHPVVGRCKATHQIVDVDWYERVYFKAQANMMLVRNCKLTAKGTLGMVLRRNISVHGESRGLFLVRVAANPDPVAEQFVIAHELGHVLLHGRLMHPGMVLVESDSSYRAEEDERRLNAELEANIYALLSVIPTGAIEALEKVLDRPVEAAELADAMSRVTGRNFCAQLAQERLILHDVLCGMRSDREFYSKILLEQTSWTRDGAAGKPAAAMVSSVLPPGVFGRWQGKLIETNVLPTFYRKVASSFATNAAHGTK